MADDFPALLFLFQEGRRRRACWGDAGAHSGWSFQIYILLHLGNEITPVFCLENYFHLNVNTCSIQLRGQRLWWDFEVPTF